jgi:DNA-binding SARP family transcriptional activator
VALAGVADRPTAPLEVRFLGTWAVHVHGQPLPKLHSRRGEWLLVLLVLKGGHSLNRHWLGGLLWPESGEEQALYNLRRNLSVLRHALGPEAWRISSPYARALALDLSGAAVDLLTFDAGVARGDTAGLADAVILYGVRCPPAATKRGSCPPRRP